MRCLGVEGWTLRRQLGVAVAVLLVLAAAAITTATTLVMSSVLQGRIDDSLRSLDQRAAGPREDGPEDRLIIDPRQCLSIRGQSTLSLCGLVDGQGSGTVVYIAEDFSTGVLGAEQLAVLGASSAAGELRTVDLPELGAYRVLAVPAGGGLTQIAGIALGPVSDAVGRTALTAAIITGAAVVIAIAVGGALVGVALRPLDRVAAIAARVSQLELATGEVTLTERVRAADTDERTEVGRMGGALNRLLGHVEESLAARHASEMQVRQFVADASHELRTPLAAIRGYAELARRTGQPVPPDVAHAMARVESESVRMTGLVTDLLLLASLDAGRPLQRSPVDLSALVVDAVGDAHMAGPGHAWLLELPSEPLIVGGDAARLQQVIGNLLANARVHTPAGTTVTTRLWADEAGGDVVLEVSDSGPGVPTALVDAVFQRFARGDSSRSRDAGSTGLGLAIAAAVVEAHGGRIGVTSVPAPGHGARFTVRLPAVAAAAALA